MGVQRGVTGIEIIFKLPPPYRETWIAIMPWYDIVDWMDNGVYIQPVVQASEFPFLHVSFHQKGGGQTVLKVPLTVIRVNGSWKNKIIRKFFFNTSSYARYR